MTPETDMNAPHARVAQISPAQAQELQRAGAVLIDVREADEHAQGMAEGALAVPRAELSGQIDQLAPDHQQQVVLLCGQGKRSLLAAENLQEMGYHNLHSVSGGFAAWREQGLPWSVRDSRVALASERYARQMRLPEVGSEGQRKLDAARVVIVGAGGLGSPAALYLAAAGVGTLGVIDDDVVERSNLHRQVLHSDARLGQAKTDSARATLSALNPAIQINTHREKLTRDNIEALFDGYDLVLDGSDNFPTRYLVNDACLKLGLTNISAAVQGFSGQLAVFAPGGPCYRCLFPEPPAPEAAPTCAEAGVLGAVPGIMGLLQALEAMKLIVGFGEPLIGRLLIFDAKTSSQRILGLSRDANCAYCDPGNEFPGYVDYQAFCRG